MECSIYNIYFIYKKGNWHISVWSYFTRKVICKYQIILIAHFASFKSNTFSTHMENSENSQVFQTLELFFCSNLEKNPKNFYQSFQLFDIICQFVVTFVILIGFLFLFLFQCSQLSVNKYYTSVSVFSFFPYYSYPKIFSPLIFPGKINQNSSPQFFYQILFSWIHILMLQLYFFIIYVGIDPTNR